MATDQEFRDLEAVVATLRRDLRESQDTINLWRQNGLGHLDSGSGKWRYGGNTMQLDRHGIQIATGGASLIAVHFVEEFGSSPGTNRPRSSMFGQIITATDFASLSLQAVGPLAPSNYSSSVGVTADASNAQVGMSASNTNGDSSSVGAYNTTTRVSVLLQGALELQNSTVTPAQITASQNDYSPTNLFKAAILRLSTDASRDITGLAGGVDGRVLLIFNVGSFDIVLKDEDAGSTDANRFALDGDITLAPDTGAVLWYDTITDRWRCAGRYSAGGGAGDVATDTLWDALGDLAVGTGANTANNLPVGTDGYVLTADSTDLSFGIKWAPAAGGPGGSTSIARTLMLMGA